LLIERRQVEVLDKPAPLPTKMIELSEGGWRRQFDPQLIKSQ
jgi:hypothetical protein